MSRRRPFSGIIAMCDTTMNLEKLEEVSIGTSILPNESGVIVKILGNSTEDIFATIYNTLKITRKKILGAKFSKIRKN